MDLLKFVAPATAAKRSARREAAEFAANVVPGRTYYSIVKNHAQHPGAPDRFLLEWKFSKPGRWIGQEARCGHLTANGAWLGYGPLTETRPRGILTLEEARNRPGIDLRDYFLTPAGV